ncbi:hypothetical protein ACOI1H_09035, partial [Loktanella sp. DJP18]|uniref:hypothetical protein n=1 Tax=Loktanella sp. DJP18 TaxID=3409788 RepID=UPI003BB4C8B0
LSTNPRSSFRKLWLEDMREKLENVQTLLGGGTTAITYDHPHCIGATVAGYASFRHAEPRHPLKHPSFSCCRIPEVLGGCMSQPQHSTFRFRAG